MQDKDLVAIVGRENNRFCVWTVYVGKDSNFGFSRLTGAWVASPHDVGDLHFWPQVLGVVISDLDFTALNQDLNLQLPRLFPIQLVDSLERETAHLNEIYVQQLESIQQQLRKSAKLVPPRWPAITAIPSAHFNQGSEGTACQQIVLDAAWWLKSLCDRWSEIEEIRLARTYMRESVSIEVRPQPWLHALLA